MIMPRKAMLAAIAAAVVLGGGVALYMFALPGLSSARPQPPEMEVAVAMWLLLHGVPATARQQHNPLGADAAAAAAGRARRRLALRRIRVLQGAPFQHLRPLEEDADGQRRA